MEAFVEFSTSDLLRHAYRLAELYSDDPMTKNGAVIVDRYGEVIGVGATSLPRGVKRSPERFDRPTKYSYLIHAERKAIFDAARKNGQLDGATMYCPWYACADCAQAIIDVGIVRVIGHKQMLDRTPDRWKQTIEAATIMFQESGVEALQHDGMIGNCTGLIDGKQWKP
jgi:dCMP deaminase